MEPPKFSRLFPPFSDPFGRPKDSLTRGLCKGENLALNKGMKQQTQLAGSVDDSKNGGGTPKNGHRHILLMILIICLMHKISITLRLAGRGKLRINSADFHLVFRRGEGQVGRHATLATLPWQPEALRQFAKDAVIHTWKGSTRGPPTVLIRKNMRIGKK